MKFYFYISRYRIYKSIIALQTGYIYQVDTTSPFRTVDFIESSLIKFLNDKSYDSARAVKLCTEHPGKMADR